MLISLILEHEFGIENPFFSRPLGLIKQEHFLSNVQNVRILHVKEGKVDVLAVVPFGLNAQC